MRNLQSFALGGQGQSRPAVNRRVEPDSQFTPGPQISAFFSITFLVRVAQNLKRFEQRHLQLSVFPSSFFHNRLQ
jgi:hypothetical protein